MRVSRKLRRFAEVAKSSTSGQGRPAGIPNKLTADVKAMILAALDKAGGIDYLARHADETPTAFLSLVGRVLPMQVTGDGAGITINIVKHGEKG